MDSVQSFTPYGPTITVFKGWQGSPVKLKGMAGGHTAQVAELASLVPPQDISEVSEQRKLRKLVKPQLAFVTGTTADRNKDEDVRQLVRSHVRNEFVRRSKRKTKLAQRNPSKYVQLSAHTAEDNQDFSVPPILGVPTALCTSEFPIPMQPHSHRLLSIYMKYVTRKAYPIDRHLKFNPSQTPEWYQFAVADAASLHGLLYAGAVYSALLEGKTESEDTVYHLSRMVSIVNKRLGHSGPIQESTISTLCCLALGEATTGHLDLWHVHMRGLKQILQARGGISSLPTILQTKVRRTDIAGAVDHAEMPYLDFHRSNRPPIWSVLPSVTKKATQEKMTSNLNACQIHPDIITTMTELALFSQTIQFTKSRPKFLLDPVKFTEDMHWIQYKLLSFPTTLREGSKEQDLNHACRIGALLYMKAILEQLPHSATGSSILLRRLQESLDRIPISKEYAPLLLWLTLIGAALSQRDLERTWFVAHLALLTTLVPLSSFHDEGMPVNSVLGLQDDLRRELERLWTEVLVVRERSAVDQEPLLAIPPCPIT